MKDSLIILLLFIAGILTGYADVIPERIDFDRAGEVVLYLMMFFVGITLSLDRKLWHNFSLIQPVFIFLPLITVAGTFVGVLAFHLLFQEVSLQNALAIGSGFGYYSLSSILISEVAGKEMGIIALLANIIRETLTLLLAPFFVRFFGPYAAITSAGATSMDTCLPVVLKYSGKEYIIISVIHGILLSVFVPLFITLIYSVS